MKASEALENSRWCEGWSICAIWHQCCSSQFSRPTLTHVQLPQKDIPQERSRRQDGDLYGAWGRLDAKAYATARICGGGRGPDAAGGDGPTAARRDHGEIPGRAAQARA